MKLPVFIEKLLMRLEEKESIKKMSAKEKWMIFLLLGLLAAVIVFPTGKKESADLHGLDKQSFEKDEEHSNISAYDVGNMSLSQYEIYLSDKLEAILAEIDGAGQVEAWVTLAGSSERVFYLEKDSDITSLEEHDSVGGNRVEETEHIDKTVVTDTNGNPYIIKTMQPEVEGVLVVAEGAGDSVIKKNISEAAQVLFGIDAHRIKVAKKKLEE